MAHDTEDYNKYFAWFALTVILILEFLLFIRLRFKMDKAAFLFLIIILVIDLSRTFIELDRSVNDGVLIEFIGPLASLSMWGILYFFVFEMISIRVTL